MGPGIAVPRRLKQNGLTLDDIDIIEMHEAFAGQVASNLKAWEQGWNVMIKLGGALIQLLLVTAILLALTLLATRFAIVSLIRGTPIALPFASLRQPASRKPTRER